jgi:hypothetical protein
MTQSEYTIVAFFLDKYSVFFSLAESITPLISIELLRRFNRASTPV